MKRAQDAAGRGGRGVAIQVDFRHAMSLRADGKKKCNIK